MVWIKNLIILKAEEANNIEDIYKFVAASLLKGSNMSVLSSMNRLMYVNPKS